jgi:predicted MFS family arabinose efflux permease
VDAAPAIRADAAKVLVARRDDGGRRRMLRSPRPTPHDLLVQMQQARWRTPFVILVLGTLILLLSLGTRQTFGLFLKPISADLGWGREVFSFAVAMQSLVWGLATPLAGAIADKWGPGRVVTAGGAIYAVGLYLMSEAASPFDATFSIGFLTGVGMASTMFPIILSVIGRTTPPHRRNLYLGIASAGGSSGMFVLVPLTQLFLDWYGWAFTLVLIAGVTALIVPLAGSVAIGPPTAEERRGGQSLGAAIREASGHSGFLLVSTAYFVCGFQTLFISAHFPAMLEDMGLSSTLGATALTVLGLFNMIGCFAWGAAGGRMRPKYLLAAIYSGRSAIMTVFILLPSSETGVIVFACALGLVWLATVPLTTAVVAQIFGPAYVATLYGFSFFTHQLGSFLGIWLGGSLYDATGSYDVIWWIAIALGLVASIMHFPVDDRPVARLARSSAGA